MSEETVVNCSKCGQFRLCRRWQGLWLCLQGKNKCYHHRKRIVKLEKRKALRKEEQE